MIRSRTLSTLLPAALLATAILAPLDAASAGAPPFPLGVYAGNPNGSSAADEAAFEGRFNSFVTTMRATPTFMNGYIDYTQPPANWPANASWTAWSWSQSPVVGPAMTPVLGIPMSDNQHWYGSSGASSNDAFFQGIVAGTYDADYQGVVDAWTQNGYHTLYLRLGYEMDGGFMPWFMGADTATQADWVAAFRHLATLMRERAARDGASVQIVWNPTDINWTALPVLNAYPGDAYVDVVSSDAYSPVYTNTLYDWVANNWSYDASPTQWAQKAGNMRHFWTYPSSNPWMPSGDGNGWGFQDLVTLAHNHNKPIAVSEAGAGGNGGSTGPVDNPVFPDWLSYRLNLARQNGITIAYVNIWDTWMSDGNWAFSMPGDGKPVEAAAWARYFGGSAP